MVKIPVTGLHDLPFSLTLYAATGLSVATIIVLLISRRASQKRLLASYGIPTLMKPKGLDFRTTLADGNKQYPDQPFMVPWADPTVIIPAHCIDSLKNLPDSQLSTNGSQWDRFAVRWTESGWVGKELAHSIKYDLANEMESLLPTLQDEIHLAASNSIQAGDEWTSITLQPALVNIVASTFGRIIVGLPRSRDKKWMSSSIDHAMSVVMFSAILRFFPIFLRPFFAHIIPQKWSVKKSKKGIANSIRPLISKYIPKIQSTAEEKTIDEEGRLVQWLLKRYRPNENPLFSPNLVLRDHYSLCFAAIHGPTFILVQAIIDLASYPEHIVSLREEADSVLGSLENLQITRETVSKLERIDRFCKESARMNPQGLVAWLRKTHKPITLSTGHTIPAETLIAAANPFYNNSATPHILEPHQFNPDRWKTLATTENYTDSAFGAAATDSLIFGFGKHACPGRPFGIAQVKLIFAEIVRRWDVRLGGGLTKRPENVCIDFMVVPPIPPFGKLGVEFRKRT